MNLDYILDDLYTRFTSRKFLAGALALLLLLSDSLKIIELDSETKKYILTVIISYIAVEGTADGIKAFRY